MRKVIGIGETVLDIIFKNEQPIGAVPGGSAFNAIISLGRSGVPTTFISETGNDRVGRQIVGFLEKNGVSTNNICVYPESKSPISLAFLNEQNDAEYLFYKDHAHDKLDFNLPDVQPDDIVLFGSYYAINPVIRPQVKGFLEYAHERGAILYYDVNFRASHKHEVVKLMPNILENLEMTDILRGSNEDFEVMFKKDDPDAVYRSQVSFYCRQFIYTQGAKDVQVRAGKDFGKGYAVPQSDTVSTIGAGDNFNAGIVYGLIKYGITRADIDGQLSEAQWDAIVDCALKFSGNVCKSLYNYVDEDFGREMKAELQQELAKAEEEARDNATDSTD